MPGEFELVMPVALPATSSIVGLYQPVNLADAFAIRLPAGASGNPDLLARFIISNQPTWIGWLTNVRDLIVARFGLKTAKHLATLDNRIGVFKVFSASQTEIVLGGGRPTSRLPSIALVQRRV